ncbi:MAG: 1-deoxy-D-xylulose-5-phosphate synthase [Clostridia bacterium]|nr:1-deoxy-D-xylulose-5-phosphate synthase [Clostridia bacterium]
MPDTGFLNRIPDTDTLRGMNKPELDAFCADVRQVLIDTVSKTGGHLASNLGVVELTVALHRAFTFPQDQVVWDVGHQCYTHKLLTGRAEAFDTLRQENGISGFPRPSESDTDCFITGHSSTSISAANGLAKAKKITGEDGYVVAVIGDGALTGGLSYEGLSNAGRSRDRLIVVLNDNRMSISRNVGFVARHLAKLRVRRRYVRFKQGFGRVLNHIPLIGSRLYRWLGGQKVQFKKRLYRSSTMFEEMGFYYLGPVDGHDIHGLDEALRTAKNLERPVLLHVVTTKGKGYEYAIKNPDIYHGVTKFDVETGRTPASSASFSSVFGQTLQKLAGQDETICAVTAAMQTGTGLRDFGAEFPSRFFDVGIAEEHAVTFCSGLAQGGVRPVFAVYATFLQRCYDQLVNDTALMNSHIVLGIDRAGIVPDDGETHQGIFDVAFMNTIPGMTVFAPATFEELELHLKQAIYDVGGPVAVRYPKGIPLPMPEGFQPGYKPYTLLHAEGAKTLLISYGRVFSNVLTAAQMLAEQGETVSVLKLNRIKPVDPECVSLALSYQRVIFFEEGIRTGGIGEWFGNQLVERDFARKYEVHAIDKVPGVCTTEAGLKAVGLDVEGILRAVRPEGGV